MEPNKEEEKMEMSKTLLMSKGRDSVKVWTLKKDKKKEAKKDSLAAAEPVVLDSTGAVVPPKKEKKKGVKEGIVKIINPMK